MGMAIANFARDVYAVDQDGACLLRSAALCQGLSFLKVRGHIVGVPVDHCLELVQAGFDISL